MERYAELNNDNIVINVWITSDSEAAESRGWISAPVGTRRGDIWDGEKFNTPYPKSDLNKLGVLSINKWTIPADGETTSVAIYTSNEPVKFIIDDDKIIEVTPDQNYCTLEIAADAPGPISVKVKDKQFTIVAEEV